jgi:hypothetical protein
MIEADLRATAVPAPGAAPRSPLLWPLLRAIAVLLAMTAIVTWPQIIHLGDAVYEHHDPFFSMWRLSWIAHALRTDPKHLFDANIFYPELRTLAYSDATMLQGLLAAPFLWAGASQVLVYNVLLMIGVLTSGLGMFVLTRYLTRNDDAALVAAAVFTLMPYRIEHLMHLELEWTVWMPLSFWALHRAFDRRSSKAGIWVGLFIALQVLSCVYYGVFLSFIVSLIAILLIASRPAEWWRPIPGLAAGAVIGAIISGIYAMPYRDSASIVGSRGLDEIAMFSAKPLSYLSSPYWNWLYGWTSERFGSGELRLFPGLVAIGLAVLGITRGPRRLVWIYLAVVLLVVELSFGLNGFIYPWLLRHVPPLHGFRVAARFSVLAFAGLSVLVAFGYANFKPARLAPAKWLLIVIAALVVEYGSAPVPLKRVTTQLPDLYRFVRGLEAGVVMEFPSSVPEALPRDDVDFQFWSTTHWKPLANGYSGYYSARYITLLERVRKFPDDRSIEALHLAGVRYLIVHRSGYRGSEFTDILSILAARRDLVPLGRFRDAIDMAQVFAVQETSEPESAK